MKTIKKPIYGDDWSTGYNHAGSAILLLNDITDSIRPHIMAGEAFRVIMDYDPESIPGWRIQIMECESNGIDQGFRKRTDLPPHLRRTPIPEDFSQGVPRQMNDQGNDKADCTHPGTMPNNPQNKEPRT